MESKEYSQIEEMRQQLAVLKDKLGKEEIVNERLLRESMGVKVKIVNRKARWGVSGCAFVVLMMPCYFIPQGYTWLFCGFTTLIMIFCAVATWWMHRNVNSHTMSGDLLTVAKVMRKLKKDYQNWLKIGIPMELVWMVWFCQEIYRVAGDLQLAITMMVGGLVGGIVGGIIGVRMHKEVIHTCDEVVKQIEEV